MFFWASSTSRAFRCCWNSVKLWRWVRRDSSRSVMARFLGFFLGEQGGGLGVDDFALVLQALDLPV